MCDDFYGCDILFLGNCLFFDDAWVSFDMFFNIK